MGTVWINQIAATEGEIFFLDLGEPAATSAARAGRLIKASRDGGSVSVLASAGPQPGGFTFDEVNLYWILADRGVMMVPRGGGTSSIISQSDAGGSIVAVGGQLYYSRDSSLVQQPVGGGPPKVIAEGEASALARNSRSVFWAISPAINALDSPSAEPRSLLSVGGYIYSMAANDEHIAWSTESAMWKLALRDGVATKIAAARGYGLALDGTHVYFRRDGQIFRLSLVSGESETLAEDDMVGSDLAVDDRFVYWANKLVPPSVKRLAK